jgi:hypothetical protein
MKKIISAVAITFVLNASCGYAATEAKPNPVQGTLKNVQSVSVSLGVDDVKSRVEYKVTGYTIFGVAYVAAAAAKMNTNSTTMQAAYDKYIHEHPDAPTIKDAFNNELKKKMSDHGADPQLVTVAKDIGKDNHVTYGIDANTVKSQRVVVVDSLMTQFFATSSSDSYHPLSFAMVSVFNADDTYAKPSNQELVAVMAMDSGYPDFDSLSKDSDHAYLALISNSEKLADKVVDKLYQ